MIRRAEDVDDVYARDVIPERLRTSVGQPVGEGAMAESAGDAPVGDADHAKGETSTDAPVGTTMTVDPASWAMAGLQLATALGMVACWQWWLRSDHDIAWWPPEYEAHERAFVLPDHVRAAAHRGRGIVGLRSGGGGSSRWSRRG